MKALVINQFGGPDAFQCLERPKPDLKAGHVLIQVRASSVNPIDAKLRSGARPAITPSFPAILHGDVSGVVSEIADDVEGFKPGDEVFGCIGGVGGDMGCLGEFALADARLIAKKPTNLTFEQSAALPLVTITAYRTLFDRIKVEPGMKILVQAACGGVGHIAIQLAKKAGAYVHGTASSEAKCQTALELGADVCINYKSCSVNELLEKHTDNKGYDVVFDTVGGSCLDESFILAKNGGVVASIATTSTHDLTPLHMKGLTLHVELMLLPLLTGTGRSRFGEILRQAKSLCENGHLSPLVDPEKFTFTKISDAHRKLESGTHMGKIVLSNDLI